MRNKRLFVVIMILVLCLAFSMMLVGCKKDEKVEDSSADDKAEVVPNYWEGLESAALSNIIVKAKEALNGGNYTFVTTISAKDTDYTSQIKVAGDAIYSDQIDKSNGKAKIDKRYEKGHGNYIYVYESIDSGEYTTKVDRTTDIKTEIKDYADNISHMVEGFADKPYEYNDETKAYEYLDNNIASKFSIKIEGAALVLSLASQAMQNTYTIKDVGVTAFEIPNIEVDDRLFASIKKGNLQSALSFIDEFLRYGTYTQEMEIDGCISTYYVTKNIIKNETTKDGVLQSYSSMMSKEINNGQECLFQYDYDKSVMVWKKHQVTDRNFEVIENYTYKSFFGFFEGLDTATYTYDEALDKYTISDYKAPSGSGQIYATSIRFTEDSIIVELSGNYGTQVYKNIYNTTTSIPGNSVLEGIKE